MSKKLTSRTSDYLNISVSNVVEMKMKQKWQCDEIDDLNKFFYCLFCFSLSLSLSLSLSP